MSCQIEGCNRGAVAKQLCFMHYKRLWRGRSKDPYNPLPRQPAFIAKSHPFYVAWTNMKTRCHNPKSTQWQYYGGRGIEVCQRWELFQNFYEDMFPEWHFELTLDRRDTNGHYEPGNCRWITQQEQCLNRRPRGAANGD